MPRGRLEPDIDPDAKGARRVDRDEGFGGRQGDLARGLADGAEICVGQHLCVQKVGGESENRKVFSFVTEPDGQVGAVVNAFENGVMRVLARQIRTVREIKNAVDPPKEDGR